MKSFILLPTGIADVPVAALDGQTPLEAAHTPNLDRLAAKARVGLVRQVPEGLRISSDAAVLSVLGYDPRTTDATRGGIEAVIDKVEEKRLRIEVSTGLKMWMSREYVDRVETK